MWLDILAASKPSWETGVLIALIDGQKTFEIEKIVGPAKILKFGILCINTINLSQLISCNIAYNHKSGIH